MKNKFMKLIFSLCIFFIDFVRGQPVHYFKPLVVTGSRLSTSLAAETRETFVLDRREIAKLPAESVSDLLQYIGGLDLRRRGAGGVQADFGLRGSSFEQVLVLVDGVRMNDPQTGHHNSDIPVTVSEIERIEVLAGHGSSLYGPDGFGGVINILTKTPIKNQTRMEIRGGSFDTYLGQFSQTFFFGPLRNRISIEKQKSDGYRLDSDYDVTTASFFTHLGSVGKEVDWSFGYMTKDFGANGFYAPCLSREKTTTYYSRLGMIYQLGSSLSFQSRIYGRRHKDDFDLDYQDPLGYQNDTRTWILGGETQLNIKFSDNKELALGIVGVEEKGKSSRLGNRDRIEAGVFCEMVYPMFSRGIIDIGLRADYEKKWGIQFNPTISFGYLIISGIRWRFSGGRVFRAPTFTELFYEDDYNKGNSTLKPEYGWCWESGLSWVRNSHEIEITLFRRDERERIDWIKWKKLEPWQATNIGETRLIGVTVANYWSLGKSIHFRFSYTGTDRHSKKESHYYSKYGFNVLRHNLLLAGFVMWPGEIGQGFVFKLKQRDQSELYGILDLKFSRQWKKMTFSLELTNLLNTKYEEIPGVPMPGKRFMLGSVIEL